jgi:transposase
MKRVTDFAEVYLCRELLDFRRGKEAMIAIIENRMQRHAMSGALFGFTNRRRDRIRCLYWDKTGYAQWSKILEEDLFTWPEAGERGAVTLTPRELAWLLDGIDITKLTPHESRHYERNS